VQVLVFLLISSLALVAVSVCDHTPWHKTWLACKEFDKTMKRSAS